MAAEERMEPGAERRPQARSTVAMHALFFLTGMGALLLAPIMPWLAASWHLQDGQSGLLIGAQFLGSFLGAVTLRPRLKMDLGLGCLLVAAGFAALALCARNPAGFHPGMLALLVSGAGLGRSITAINLIAGAHFRRHRGSALSLLNLTWGIGAVCAPALVGFATGRMAVPGVSGSFVLAFALIAGVCWRNIPEEEERPHTPEAGVPASLIYFAILFFLYGGLESSLSGWLSTLTTRSFGGTLRGGAFVTTCLWLGLTAGRALSSVILLRVGEVKLIRAGLLLTALCGLMLPRAGEHQLAALAILTGLGLAPAFAVLCSLLLTPGRNPGRAGTVMAVSSLGGVLFPWLVGLTSDRSGSIARGLIIPEALACGLFLLLGQRAAGAFSAGKRL